MGFQLKDFLGAIGPGASIVFAAWIFMGFLQQRYTDALERYRVLIQGYRVRDRDSARYGNIRDQVLLYKRRFELMRIAVNLGLIAACLLIATLIGGGLNIMFPKLPGVNWVSSGFAIGGFLLVIVAAGLVLWENFIIRRAVYAELLDVPELAERTGQVAGDITDPRRPHRL